ncbi:MAG: hypothetical protein B6I28_05345 [Fusobacteriia bacterium 4572_132]|nr:MAG: hypothetical protein B6I28_05345 [Fusobacteriia bacterium 4572_132]
MKNKLEEYLKTENYDMEITAKELKNSTEKFDVMLESQIKTLKNEIKEDIRESVPVQIYSVISSVISIIEKIDEV